MNILASLQPPTPDPRPRLGLGLGRFPAPSSQPHAYFNLNLNLNQSASPSPISDRVSGRLAPACRGYGDLPASKHLPTFPPSHLATSSTPSPLNPFIPRRPPAGFSLTEVVIALGIFAVSMIGVLALFPVASSTGRESSEETQAAILAETIISDLRTSTAAKGKSGGWIVRGPNTFNASQWLRPIILTNSSTNFVVYDLVPRVNSSGPDGVGMIGQPVALKAIFTNLTLATYSNAINSTSAVFGSRIAIEPLPSLPGLALVTVTVDSPVSANLTNRRTYSFSSLLSAP